MQSSISLVEPRKGINKIAYLPKLWNTSMSSNFEQLLTSWVKTPSTRLLKNICLAVCHLIQLHVDNKVASIYFQLKPAEWRNVYYMGETLHHGLHSVS